MFSAVRIPPNGLIMVYKCSYNGLLLPLISYWIAVWWKCYGKVLTRVQIALKDALRAISNQKCANLWVILMRNTSSLLSMKSTKWLWPPAYKVLKGGIPNEMLGFHCSRIRRKSARETDSTVRSIILLVPFPTLQLRGNPPTKMTSFNEFFLFASPQRPRNEC